jgi:hypothetical protein
MIRGRWMVFIDNPYIMFSKLVLDGRAWNESRERLH